MAGLIDECIERQVDVFRKDLIKRTSESLGLSVEALSKGEDYLNGIDVRVTVEIKNND